MIGSCVSYRPFGKSWRRTRAKRVRYLPVLVEESYRDLEPSLRLSGEEIPPLEQVELLVKMAINDDHLSSVKVNSENQIEALLDGSGQLRLRTPLNLFIGGQILTVVSPSKISSAFTMGVTLKNRNRTRSFNIPACTDHIYPRILRSPDFMRRYRSTIGCARFTN